MNPSGELGWLLSALDPQQLRERFSFPLQQWREEFVPAFLVTDDYGALMTELSRFVGYLLERWFGGVMAWPADQARTAVVRLLNARFGAGGDPRTGALVAMRICRHGEQGGLRYLLDELGRELMREVAEQYANVVVLTRIGRLTPEEKMDLARQYLDGYPLQPSMELESPAAFAMRWHEVVHEHIRSVLGL